MTSPPPPTVCVQDPSPVVYFVSDVHLGGSPPTDEAVKRERLDALFDRVEAEHGSLYVLGDLFDFWFGYRTVVPRAALGVLHRLDGLARSGSRVFFLGGNHDWWLCDFLRRETAVAVLTDGARVEAQGRHLTLVHGDGLGPGDTGYKLLKRVLRNRAAIGLFRWIHPDLGIPLALRSSGVSRHYTAERHVDVEGLYRHVGEPAFREGADAVLLGHHHVAVHLDRPEGEMLFLGDWFRQYTCARLAGGRLDLLAWPLDGSSAIPRRTGVP
jgi:UDP-2,3-diacylglucosamine hydrolase